MDWEFGVSICKLLYIYKTEIYSQTQTTNVWFPKGKGGGVSDKLGVQDEQIHTTIYKIDKQQGLTVQDKKLQSIPCNKL